MTSDARTCPKCKAATAPDDNFCQDCGQRLAVEQAAAKPEVAESPDALGYSDALEKPDAPEKSNVLRKSDTLKKPDVLSKPDALENPDAIDRANAPEHPDAVLTCLNCGTQHEKPMKYCGSCGSLMSDIGVYTTTTKAIQSASQKEWTLPKIANTTVTRQQAATAATAKPAEPAAPSAAPGAVAKPPLQSPLLHRSVNPANFDGALAYTPPRTSRPLLDLSIAVLVLTFFGLLIWWLVDLERSHSSFSRKEGLIQAQAATGSGRLDEALRIMEMLSLSHSGNLNKEEQDTLNNILYMRANKFAEKQNYRLALSDLLRITPDFSLYAQARKKIELYSQPKQLEKPVATASRVPPAVKPDAPEAGRPVPVPVEPAQKKPAGNVPVTRQPVETQEKISVPEKPKSQKTTITKTKDGTLFTTSRWNYTDDDVVKYDKMLADYFSVDRLSTRRTIKEGLGVSAANREPPSFKEWLDQGKPNF